MVSQLLLDHGADIDVPTSPKNYTPLMWAWCSAARDQLPPCTKFLLDRGSKVNDAVNDCGGNTALHQACYGLWRFRTMC
jgi:ankyrin repeat protein